MEPDELGAGVRVLMAGEGQVEVRSERLDLSWQPRRAALVGSAVLWRGELYEVAGRLVTSAGDRWELRRWPEGEAVRGVFRLDATAVEALAAADRRRRRDAARRLWALPLAPLLALAPGRLQRRWRAVWGFPAGGATLISASLELAAGAFVLIHALAAAVGGGGAASGGPAPLLVLGPLLWVEALARLFAALGRGEPMGSAVGLPLLLLERRTAPAASEAAAPSVHGFDADAGLLEMSSPVRRPDWSEDGTLHYRGEPYRLVGSDRLGRGWLYRFRRAAEDDGPVLRLAPAPVADTAAPRLQGRGHPPGALRTVLVTALACLAPGDLQALWAERLHTRPQWFTALGALCELLGGVVNLRGDVSGLGVLGLLDLLLVLEGLARLLLLAVTGGPVGSVLGRPMRPILERMMSRSG